MSSIELEVLPIWYEIIQNLRFGRRRGKVVLLSWVFGQLAYSLHAPRCQTDNDFFKCSWAHVVISMTESSLVFNAVPFDSSYTDIQPSTWKFLQTPWILTILDEEFKDFRICLLRNIILELLTWLPTSVTDLLLINPAENCLSSCLFLVSLTFPASRSVGTIKFKISD